MNPLLLMDNAERAELQSEALCLVASKLHELIGNLRYCGSDRDHQIANVIELHMGMLDCLQQVAEAARGKLSEMG